MGDIIIILLAIVVGLLAGGTLVWFLRKKDVPQDEGALKLLLEQMNELSRTVDAKMGESFKNTQEAVKHQFGESQKLIKDVTEGLTKLDETNRQVISFADQLQSLQDVLQNPKRRGVLGEYYLETVLKNVLPPSAYKMQYKIRKGEGEKDFIVDAVIFVQEKIIPVDSKFSLENYNRLAEEKDDVKQKELERLFKQDLKNRIDETAKYIRPEDNTMDFALMFIPSEAIFYDLIINKIGTVKVNTEELIQYAAKKRVSIVSPNSFYAFLQVILHGLNQLKIEKNTEVIRKRVGDLGRHIKSYEQYFTKIGVSLKSTVNNYNSAYKELGKVDKDIMRISEKSPGIEPDLIEGPETDY